MVKFSLGNGAHDKLKFNRRQRKTTSAFEYPPDLPGGEQPYAPMIASVDHSERLLLCNAMDADLWLRRGNAFFIKAGVAIILTGVLAGRAQTESTTASEHVPARTQEQSASQDANLPADYRAQIMKLELKQNSRFGKLIMSYADPIRVLVQPSSSTGPAKEMTAVIYDFTPYSKDGAIYFMIMQGSAALFEKGVLVNTIGVDSRLIEWIDGKPQIHADSPGARKDEVDAIFRKARSLRDPTAGPIERRTLRHEVWQRYTPAMTRLGVPPEKAVRLRELLEQRTLFLAETRLAAFEQGVDPFSGAMNKLTSTAKKKVEKDLADFLGEDQIKQLDYLGAVMAHEPPIERDEGVELDDAGVPLSSEQLFALAKIREDLSFERNPDYSKTSQNHDATTGLSGLDQAMLDRASEVVTRDQLQVLRRRLMDKGLHSHFPEKPLGDPVYGPIFRREIRRELLRNYSSAISDLNLQPDITARVKDLLLELNIAPREASYAAQEKGLDQMSTLAASKAAKQEIVRQLTVLLGEATYQRLEKRKNHSYLKKMIIEGEATELEIEGYPLTRDQLRALQEAGLDVLTSENPDYVTLYSKIHDTETGLTAADDAFLKRASVILTPQQQRVVRTYESDKAFERRRQKAEEKKYTESLKG